MIVRRLLGELDVTTTPPVDVVQVAKQLGIEVVERPGFELGGSESSGLLLRMGGRTICVINADHHRNRKRFSVAHEIGHFLLHPFKETYHDVQFYARDQESTEGTNPQEVEANAFAAELLMPEDLMKKAVLYPLNVVEDEDEIRRLSKRFLVSQQAMTHRLTNLHLLGLS